MGKRSLNLIIALAALWSAVLPATVHAGILDSPLPVLDPAKSTRLLFLVPGVIKNNHLETVFICTSLDTRNTAMLGIEVFGANGGPPLNDASNPVLNGALPIQPGETRTITTGSTVAFHENQIITLPAASLRNGSARIVSTSKKIMCSVLLVDELTDPPTSMAALRVISKKQRGD